MSEPRVIAPDGAVGSPAGEREEKTTFSFYLFAHCTLPVPVWPEGETRRATGDEVRPLGCYKCSDRQSATSIRPFPFPRPLPALTAIALISNSRCGENSLRRLSEPRAAGVRMEFSYK